MLFIYLFIYFFIFILISFSCSGMFRNVPERSMFLVLSTAKQNAASHNKIMERTNSCIDIVIITIIIIIIIINIINLMEINR